MTESESSAANIVWPAIIKLNGDDELIYIATADQLYDDQTLQHMQFHAEDQLIDSTGNVYRIIKHHKLELKPTSEQLSLDQIELLLQRHLSNHGTCCVAKFHSNSIDEAISSVFG